MKKLIILSILLFVMFVPAYAAPAAPPAPVVEITLLNPPPGGELHLNVGESYTLEIQVDSSEEFTWAKALSDKYYPGKRYVTVTNSDMVHSGTSATLYVTITAVGSTADLPAACDFPDAGTCWSAGSAPVGAAVGARFQGGVAIGEFFYFDVFVP